MLVSALWRMISPQYSEGAARCRAARWSGLVAIPPARDCEPGHRRKAVAMAAAARRRAHRQKKKPRTEGDGAGASEAFGGSLFNGSVTESSLFAKEWAAQSPERYSRCQLLANAAIADQN